AHLRGGLLLAWHAVASCCCVGSVTHDRPIERVFRSPVFIRDLVEVRADTVHSFRLADDLLHTLFHVLAALVVGGLTLLLLRRLLLSLGGLLLRWLTLRASSPHRINLPLPQGDPAFES